MTASIPTSELTESSLAGTGVFDELMRSTKAHLHEEFTKGRIKGPEYAQVYLGSVNAVLQQSMQFLLEREKAFHQAELLKEQITSEQNQHDLQAQQLLNTKDEGALLKLQADKLVEDTKAVEAGTALTEQQKLNAEKENIVLVKQACKLDGEFDVLVETRAKTAAETSILAQKKKTEEAQTNGAVASPDSVIGRQNFLYETQAKGLIRDAEQKAAKIMVDSWNVRRTTDPDVTGGNDVNSLSDGDVGRMVNKLMSGVQA